MKRITNNMENNKKDYQIYRLLFGVGCLGLGIGLSFVEETKGLAPLFAGFGFGFIITNIN